jgi:hypothetical protein
MRIDKFPESGIREKHRMASPKISGSTLNIKERRSPLIDEPVTQRTRQRNLWREELIFPKDIDVKR